VPRVAWEAESDETPQLLSGGNLSPSASALIRVDETTARV
jgi:hypothetical protein